MTSDTFDLEARLLPERLRLDLARIGVVLATEQVLSSLVVDQVVGFLDPTAPLALEGHRERPEVWDTRLEESLEWLVDNETLSPDDAVVVRALRAHALELMASVTSCLLGDGKTVRLDLLTSAAEVVVRLDRFWGRIAVDTNPAFDSKGISDEDIVGGSMALVGILLAAVRQP